MKTTKTLFLLTLLAPLFGRGQTGNEYILTISTPEAYHMISVLEPLEVQNIVDTVISGEYESYESVAIIPKVGTSIGIVNFTTGNTSNGGGGGTTIRSRPPIGPRMASPSLSDSVSNVTVFPNPVDKELNFQLNDEKVVGYSIFDLLGNNKMQEKIEPCNEYKVDVSMLSGGCYILLLITEKNQNISIQFLKK